MSSDHVSTRVNSARLPDFIDKTIRLTCKVLQRSQDTMTVQASDDGEVLIQLSKDTDVRARDTYVEIIGKVVNATTVRMLSCTNLGQEPLDMKLVNDTVELVHDPRFYQRMFS